MRKLLLVLSLSAVASAASANMSEFTKGPVFKEFGPVADVEATMPIPRNAVFRHSFDVAKPAAEDQPNRTLVSAARFINMHVRAGVPLDNIHLAVIVHGKAVMEVADEFAGSAELVAALIDEGVRIIVCGQSAVYYDIATEDLLPGVEMAISAMTAHALLQQRGYTLNPF